MRILLLMACVVLVLGANAFAQINFTDNFDDGNIDGWTLFDPIGFALGEPHAEVTFPDGTVRLNGPPHPAFGSGAAAINRPGVVFSDFEETIDIVENNSSVDGFIGLGARTREPFHGYFLGFAAIPPGAPASNVVSLTRSDGPGGIVVLDEVFIDDLPRDGLRLVFAGEGNTLTGNIFNLADLTTPLVTLTAEDATYPVGYGEFFTFGGTPPPPAPPNLESFGNARFDNYSLVATVPEPSSMMLSIGGFGLLALFRHRKA